MTDLLTVEQVAERLGCSRRRVFQLLADGTLERAPRFGRRVRVFGASVERALAPPPARGRRRRAGPDWNLADLRADLLA